MDIPKYHYGAGWQRKVVALCYRDPVFLKFHADVLKPQWFESFEHQALMYLILVHFRQKNDRPTPESLEASIRDYAERYGGVKSEESKLKLLTSFEECNRSDLSDIDTIKDRVVQFGQRQALKGAVGDIIGLIDKDDGFPQAREILDNALNVGVTRELGTDLFTTASQLHELVKDDPLFSPKHKTPTYLPTLDRYLGGGLGVGELGVLAAPPGRGKSTGLINFGRGALYHFTKSGANKTVIHISNELKEQDLVLKYVSCITGIRMQDIIKGDLTHQDILQSQGVLHHNSVRIKYFSPGSIDVSDIRGYISFLEAQEGITPGLLIVDYADRLSKDGKLDRDYAMMGMIYDQLIQLGDEYKIPVWTASQIRRENFREPIIGLDGLSDSWLKNANADVVITLNQTPEDQNFKEIDEQQREMMRFFMAKVRRGEDLGQIACLINKYTATIKEQYHEKYPSLLRPGSLKGAA